MLNLYRSSRFIRNLVSTLSPNKSKFSVFSLRVNQQNSPVGINDKFSLNLQHDHSTMSDETSQYVLPNDQPIVWLKCEKAFEGLTLEEKQYAHYLSKASWNGGLITLIQTSPESPLIFTLLHKIFLSEPLDKLKQSVLKVDVTEDEFTAFLVYACGIYGNCGNYKGYGDSKIIPNLPKEKFEKIVKASKVYRENPKDIQNIWNLVNNVIYSLESEHKNLGLSGQGITTYFSENCTKADADLVNEFMQVKVLESYNTRCFKSVRKENGKNINVYNIRLASVETGEAPNITLKEETFKNAKFLITRGDYSPLLSHVNENLLKAKKYAANDNQKNMLDKYIEHFKTGSLDNHKDGSRFWIKDKGPVVESYIGFIEVYRDPSGQRGEFEGFVAAVDKEMSKKFGELVDKAEELLPKLPWGAEFEKDTFLRPDFTSLDIISFSGSGIPIGINIPNYNEIRQSEGFKNVSLGNVINCSMNDDKIPFLSPEDENLMNKYRLESLEVQVALHELLGHGSGKLLRQLGENSYNFDHKHLINPLTGKLVDKFYTEGQTYDSVFGDLGSPYEECRAEAVGLYLCLDKDVLKIFGYEGQVAEDVIYANWLSELWAGCAKTLEMYQPTTKKWLQSHSQARYVLLRVCLEAGEDFVKVTESEPGKSLTLTVDRSKIHTVGKKAMGELLKKLQIYRSTGDIEGARKMFEKYSEVPESGPHPWAKWREIVLAHKRPRKIYVQANTSVKDNNVKLTSYEGNFAGLIQSWIERFPSEDILDVLVELWEKDKEHFSSMNTTQKS